MKLEPLKELLISIRIQYNLLNSEMKIVIFEHISFTTGNKKTDST